jgi:hypothetical protein
MISLASPIAPALHRSARLLRAYGCGIRWALGCLAYDEFFWIAQRAIYVGSASHDVICRANTIRRAGAISLPPANTAHCGCREIISLPAGGSY